MNLLTQAATDPRVLRSRQRRAEEQVVAAVLHASSLLGFIAIIGSASVWSRQRSRSRFLAIQSRQALLFHIITAIGLLITFVLFMAGFQYVAFSGLIARTGAREPELTNTLITAALVGGATILFFLVLLPLVGVWGAIRVLRGHNFRYPILGRIVERWYARQNASETASASHPSAISNSNDDDITSSTGAHLSILVGLGPMVALVQWAAVPNQSIRLTHSLDASGAIPVVSDASPLRGILCLARALHFLYPDLCRCTSATCRGHTRV